MAGAREKIAGEGPATRWPRLHAFLTGADLSEVSRLKTRAASGVSGCVKARTALRQARHEQLRRELGR